MKDEAFRASWVKPFVSNQCPIVRLMLNRSPKYGATMAEISSAISGSTQDRFERQDRVTKDAGSLTATDNQVGAAEMQALRSGRSQSLASDALPSLDLIDSEGSDSSSDASLVKKEYEEESSWLDVVYEVGSGMVDQVIENPGEVALNAAIGVGIGVGAALLAPEIAIAAGVAGAAYGAYQVYENIGDWLNDADTVANQQDHTETEIAAAKAGLHDFGGGLTNVVSGAAGGAIGSLGTVGIKNAFNQGAADLFNTVTKTLPVNTVEATPALASSVLPATSSVFAVQLPNAGISAISSDHDY